YVVDADPTEPSFKLKFSAAAGHAIASPLTDVRHISDLHPNPIPKLGDAIRVVTISLEVLSPMGESLGVWPDFPVDPKHATGGLPDSMFARFSEDDEARLLPIVATPAATLTPLGVLDALFGGATHATDAFDNEAEMEKGVICEHLLTGGNDGIRPG